jgi:hypothetical protein
VNGLTVYANGDPGVWPVTTAAGSTLDLPQYGWFAQNANVTAYTALVDGVTADFAQTKQSLFVDARTSLQANANTGITAALSSFSQTGPGQFTAAITWNTSQTAVPAGYVPFVQVTDPQTGAVEFSIDQTSLGAASAWTVGQPVVQTPVSVALPAGLADGIYDIRAGLWNPITTLRMPIDGTSDGLDNTECRAIIRRLQVSNSGTVLSDDPQIDFGNVQTDGSFEMNRQHSGIWSLIPFPRTQPIQVSLNAPNIDPAWQTLHMVAFDVNNVSLGDVPCTQMANGEWQFTLNTVRHATHYLLTP